MSARVKLNLSFRLLFCLALAWMIIGEGAARGQELPDYIKLISPRSNQPKTAPTQPKNPGQIASQNVLALDKGMMGLYAKALKQFQANILSEVPVIIARFTGAGGELTLFRPGQPPLTAPAPPIAYQYAKSCGHSAMAIYQLTMPFITDPSGGEWRKPMTGYRTQIQAALGTLDSLEVTDEQRALLRDILENNINFMNQCLKNSTFTLKDLEAFAGRFKPMAEKAIWMAADAQVSHWMSVLDEWKKLLGDDWDKLHAATNTIYVTRQNNIFFSILVQYMGKEAIHKRLLLFETTDFVTTREQMLSLLTRIIADRTLGKVYFGDYYLMDYELLGSGARRAIIEQCEQRGMTPILPPMSPFNSTEWPWRTNPKSGTGPATLEQTGMTNAPVRIRQRKQDN